MAAAVAAAAEEEEARIKAAEEEEKRKAAEEEARRAAEEEDRKAAEAEAPKVVVIEKEDENENEAGETIGELPAIPKGNDDVSGVLRFDYHSPLKCSLFWFFQRSLFPFYFPCSWFLAILVYNSSLLKHWKEDYIWHKIDL